ncbi:SDR family NAD(P)-dependent oxidoreductase [Mangrovivirga cuniculi]|uniref:SDR family NAD(P)-dependent oxidoreductase n=1 Tax=Mangrovivirga cuniculi TaxID=2715131 RepID=UPI0021D0561D|nr:SDR family NAD(P)-dependent oxidoreductase [Mangrovivirga cuniculi]
MYEDNIKNKIAIITGGGGVLGSAMASGLASRGAKIVLLGRTSTKLDKAKMK